MTKQGHKKDYVEDIVAWAKHNVFFAGIIIVFIVLSAIGAASVGVDSIRQIFTGSVSDKSDLENTLEQSQTQIKVFSDSMVSLIIPVFGGAQLQKHFGSDGFNYVLKSKLSIQFIREGLDKFVTVWAVSKRIGSLKEAQLLRDSSHADAILWGSVTRLDETIKLDLFLDIGKIGFENSINNLEPMKTVFELGTIGEYTLMLSDSAYNLNDFVERVVTDIGPLLAVKIADSYPTLAAKLIKELPSRSEYYRKMEVAPFLLQIGAWSLERSGDSLRAMEVWAISFDKFEELKYKTDSGKVNVILPDSILRRFAAGSKWQEGYLAFALADTIHALNCFAKAASVDSAIVPSLFQIFDMLTGSRHDTIHIKDFHSPFQ